jgi:HicA-like toxin of HicAB toxin-antitoxin system
VSNWPAAKASRVLAALLRIGWKIKRQSGSHRTLERAGGRISSSLFTTPKRSALVCWRVLLNAQVFPELIFEFPFVLIRQRFAMSRGALSRIRGAGSIAMLASPVTSRHG